MISSAHITVEHTFGLWKARFPSLKAMGRHEKVIDLFKAIEALMILHNICLVHGDAPESLPNFEKKYRKERRRARQRRQEQQAANAGVTFNRGFIDVEDDANVPAHETEENLKRMGRMKRQALFDLTVPVPDLDDT